MSHASLVPLFAPALDLPGLAAVRRAAGVAGRLAAFAAAGVAAAALVWLLLAGPGFGFDHTSTVPVRHAAPR